MELLEFIEKWDINRAGLSTRIKMVKSTFVNKLNKRAKLKFSIAETDKLVNVLRLMEKDLHDTIKHNWVSGQDKEKVCPSCGSEKATLKGNEFKCPVCEHTWLAIHTPTTLL